MKLFKESLLKLPNVPDGCRRFSDKLQMKFLPIAVDGICDQNFSKFSISLSLAKMHEYGKLFKLLCHRIMF